jgi:hypothetical protein
VGLCRNVPLFWDCSAAKQKSDDRLYVRIVVGVLQGEIGICVLSRETGEVLAHRELTAADANSAVELLVGPIGACGELVIRNASSVGAAGLIEVHSAETFAVDLHEDGLHYDLRSPIVYNQSRVEALSSGGVCVSVPEDAWAYAAKFPLFRSQSTPAPRPNDFLSLRITIGSLRGEVGICILSRDDDRVLAQ